MKTTNGSYDSITCRPTSKKGGSCYRSASCMSHVKKSVYVGYKPVAPIQSQPTNFFALIMWKLSFIKFKGR